MLQGAFRYVYSHHHDQQMMHGSKWDMKIWRPEVEMSHEGVARVWHFQPRVVIFPRSTNDCVSYVLSYGQPLI